MEILLVLLGLALVGALVLVVMHNGLVAARAHVRESWSGVDVELKRRHDLIPSLVATAKGHAAHEGQVFERLAELREDAEALRGDLPRRDLAAVEGRLASTLARLVARLEAYPELKSDQHFLALQAELANTEDRIQGSLRFYNGNVRELNVKCESFPTNLVAAMFGFQPAAYFKLEDEAARAVPEVRA
jgi:LemA protein